MPDTFAVTDTGLVLVSNGIDPVTRWTGRGQSSPAGLPRPPAGAAGSGNGSGPIGGLPPVAPIYGSDPYAPSLNVPSPGTFVDYVAYMRYVDADGNVGDFSPPIQMRVQAARQIAYYSIPVPADPRVAAIQVFRNTDGQLTTFYLDAEGMPAPYDIDTGPGSPNPPDLIPGQGGSARVIGLFSTKTDDVLQTQQAVPLFDDGGQPFANAHAPPPDYYSVIVPHIGRMFMAGVEDYAEGSVELATNSAVVVGTGTEWPGTFAGRFLHVPGYRPVEIAACDQGTQTLTLLAPWLGSADKYSSYAVRPAPALGNGLAYSNAGEPESWPACKEIAVTDDGDRVRALMPYGSFLYVIKERNTYRLTAQADPGRDGFLFPASRRGVLSQKCWVVADEVAYLMDRQGVYQFSGSQPQDVSGQIQNLFRDSDGPRINFACARWFHAVASPGEQAVKFFVTLYGDKYPRHALVYYYRIGKWTVERFPEPVAAAVVARTGRPGGWSRTDDVLMLGGGSNRILAFDAAPTDAAPALTLRVGFSTAACVIAGTIRSGTNLANVPVVVSNGRGVGQQRVIVENMGGYLFIDRPWAVKPDSTSELIVGGIACRADLSAIRMNPVESQEGCSVELRHRPSRDSRAALEVSYDYESRDDRVRPDQPGGDIALDLRSGFTIQRLDQHRERQSSGRRFVRLSVRATSGKEPFGLDETLLNGVV